MTQKVLSAFLMALIMTAAQAQKTGYWVSNITFNNEQRQLAGFTPKDYDETKAYHLIIGLHGDQDNAVNYRNTVVNSFDWQNVFTNTIFVFPDGGSDPSKDFYQPEGDEMVIAEAVAFAKKQYNIDESHVILQGFSMGGRSALKYGLDHPEDFRGLLLNTPALQGIKDGTNQLPDGPQFVFENGNKIPMYITVGGEDILFLGGIEAMQELLVDQNAKSHLLVMPFLDHTVSPKFFTEPAVEFFKKSARATIEAHCYKSEMKHTYCESTVVPSFKLVNQGAETITSVDIQYTINEQEKVAKWEGSLPSFEHKIIELPEATLNDGSVPFGVTITAVNGVKDSFEDNNHLDDTFFVASNGINKPVLQGFETEDDPWVIEESDNIFTWYPGIAEGRRSEFSITTLNTMLLFNTAGLRESFYSPPIDLSAMTIPSMALDVAFNYHRFEEPYFNPPQEFADTLEISVSVDCGETYTTIFKKGGADLATVPSPLINPVELTNNTFIPEDNEWRTLSFDLDQFGTSSQAIVRFTCISGQGGNMLIDNIQFDEALSDNRKTLNSDNISIFPNPTSTTLNLDIDMQSRGEVKLVDALGKTVYQQTQNFEPGQPSAIYVGQFTPGVYWLQVQTEKGSVAEKVVIKN